MVGMLRMFFLEASKINSLDVLFQSKGFGMITILPSSASGNKRTKELQILFNNSSICNINKDINKDIADKVNELRKKSLKFYKNHMKKNTRVRSFSDGEEYIHFSSNNNLGSSIKEKKNTNTNTLRILYNIKRKLQAKKRNNKEHIRILNRLENGTVLILCNNKKKPKKFGEKFESIVLFKKEK